MFLLFIFVWAHSWRMILKIFSGLQVFKFSNFRRFTVSKFATFHFSEVFKFWRFRILKCCFRIVEFRILFSNFEGFKFSQFEFSKFEVRIPNSILTQSKHNPLGRLSPQASWIRPRPVFNRPARAVSDWPPYIIFFETLWAEAHSDRKKHRRYRMYVFPWSQ